MADHSAEANAVAIDADNLGYFRWGQVGDRWAVTTDAGDWAILTHQELEELLTGAVGNGHERFEEFQAKGFLRDGLDLDAVSTKMAQRNRHVRRGAHVHVVTVDDAGTAMSEDTAAAIAHFALESMSPAVSYEVQAADGEPLKNFAAIRRLVDAAQEKNTLTTGKKITFRVQTNLTAMTEEIAEWLIEHDVLVSTRLDGPAAIHDANREHLGGSSHADTVRWIDHFHRRYAESQRDPKQSYVEGRVAVTRAVLGAANQVLDEYVQRGIPCIQLQPLDATTCPTQAWSEVGYDVESYTQFYREFLQALLDANRRGIEIAEGRATIFAMKILAEEDPGIVDIQSPYGAGTGQLAYAPNGNVYPCEEARAIDTGEETFLLGHVSDLTIGTLAEHPTVRAIAAASLLDTQPMCADCFNKPYCGFSPVRSYATQGDLFGWRSRCFECKEHMGIAQAIFSQLATDDQDATEILKRWTVVRSPHLIDTRADKPAL